MQQSLEQFSPECEKEVTPPRPTLPFDIADIVERKLEKHYKKIPKIEQPHPRPSIPKAPLPPGRSKSLGLLRTMNTPKQEQIAQVSPSDIAGAENNEVT